LNHVSHPACGRGHQDAERQRLHLVAGELVASEIIAYLGAVAVHDRDAPAAAGQVYHRRETFARVAELVGDRGALTDRGNRVPTQRHDDRSGVH
jgi:hypothetical protein